MMLVEPLHERSARVQRNPQLRRVALEQIQKRQVAVLICLLEDPAEVSHRLMVVQDQAEAKRIHGANYRELAKIENRSAAKR